jgi:uncharacterized SAM-binding protein YcdF (DUF218 family)
VLDPSLSDPFWWRALAKTLVLPPAAPIAIALAGFVLMVRRRRAGRLVAMAGVLLLALLAMPAIGALLLKAVDISPPFDPSRVDGARAIVIIGGGVRRDAAEYGGDTLARLTLERVRYGARVARQTSLPVLVSGGIGLGGGASEASLMRTALESEFGVAVRWVEDRSRTTHENARMSAAILRSEGIDRVVLVAHGFDMRRAIAEFAAAGIGVVAAPTSTGSHAPSTLLDFVPSIDGLTKSYYALYELIGEAVRRLSA